MTAASYRPPTPGRRFTAARVILFLLIVAALFLWQGYQKIPAGPASGTSLNGPAPATEPTGDILRVATFNIDGKAESGTVDTLRGFDLAGLEEVHGHGPFGGQDEAQILGEKLGLQWLFAPVERQWWADAFGDGVVTSLHANHWQRFPIANEGADSNREVLLLNLQFQGKPLNVLITHLERNNDRDAELASVISLFQSLQAPAILMGDLNSPNDDPNIQALRKSPGVIDPIGDLLKDPNAQSWDRIFARGMKSTNAGFIDKGASDHPLAWANLELTNSPQY